MSDSPPSPSPSGGAGGKNCQDLDSLSGTDQLLCLIQDPYSGTFHADAFWASLGTSIGVMLLITLAFSLMRPRNTIVYAPKTKYADEKHAPPKLGKGLFDWVGPVTRTKEVTLVEKTGMDATIFLRFTRMLRNMFLALSAVGFLLLLPANVISADRSQIKQGSGGQNYFATMTPQYIGQKRHGSLWVHVASVWAIDLIVGFFLWWNYVAVTSLRRQYFESPEYLMSLHSRTLMITDIPLAERTDEGIMRLADSIKHTPSLPRATIGRNVKELPDLIEEHEEVVRELESVLAKYLKNPDNLPAKRPTMRASKKYRANNGTENVDSIDYLTGRIQELEIEIGMVRESIDKRNPMPFGFASYERIEEAHTVAFAAKKKPLRGTVVKLAPKPNDLIWKNLPLTKQARGWRRFWNNFWIVVLTLIWIAPNALIAIFLSNLSHLASIWPGFRHTFQRHQTTWSAVQGIAAPALTSLIYLILPIIFRRLSMRGGDTTKTTRERHVTTKLYAFFVFNNLVVFSIFSVIYGFVAAVIKNRQDKKGVWDAVVNGYFFYKLLAGLSQVSYFWVIWLLQRQLGAAADLAQMINLVWVWFCRTFLSPTPRQEIEWTAPPPFDYAVYYNYFLFYATVALCFSTLQPLVLPITAIYFAIDYWLKKYLLLYVLITKNESGGQHWRILFNRVIFGVVLSNIVMGLVIRGADGGWFKVFFMIPPGFLILGLKYYCSKTFDDQITFYTKATLRDPENLAEPGKKVRKNDRIASRFGHPALYKPLMTPMVHAKARHVLSQVYRGRLDADGLPTTTYSDIAMDPMSHTQPGKTARFAPPAQKEMFEVVPESHLDFEYFKNRDEFADALGGNGELYGKPEDLISERSSTPRSFLGRHGSDSGASSRASSPGGGGSERSSSAQRRYEELNVVHPAYRDRDQQDGDLGQQLRGSRGMYNLGNESENRLLYGAQPLGVGTPGEEAGREQYGLDRWRTGGSGYVGVPATEVDDRGYDAYRGRR